MASITSEQTSYLRFCDEAGNKEKNGANDYTDAVFPTNTILCLGGDAGVPKMKIKFQGMNGTHTADEVDITYNIAKYGLPTVLNEMVKLIQKPGMTMIDVCDVNLDIRGSETFAQPAACVINCTD